MARVLEGPGRAVQEEASCEAGDVEPRQGGTRWLGIAAAALLATWCGLGLIDTARHLANPEIGWKLARPAEARGSIGLPLPRAPEVTAIRQLLRSADPATAGAWLVVYPPHVDRIELEYVRAQLVHLEYPRRIDVISTSVPAPMAAYSGFITHPQVSLQGSRGLVGTLSGFAAYRWPS